MDIDKIINECGIEIGIEECIAKINEKIKEYKLTRNKDTSKELAELLSDRDKIYNFDKETIKKYININ